MASGGSSSIAGAGAGGIEILVMVKSLLSRCDTHVAECRREIDLFSRVNHDHVVRLVGLCYQTDPVYLVTEYCEWVSIPGRCFRILSTRLVHIHDCIVFCQFVLFSSQ